MEGSVLVLGGAKDFVVVDKFALQETAAFLCSSEPALVLRISRMI